VLASSSSAYRETLCLTGGPCGRYSGLAAAGYAVRWDLAREGKDNDRAREDHNRNWDFFGGDGGDCTNFASQALKAGGMRFMRAHGLNSPNASDADSPSKFIRGEGSWWSYFQDVPQYGTSFTVRYYTTATSFIRSQTLYNHLIGYALAELVGPGGKVRAGDLVFYNLHGVSLDGLDHTQIVTRVTRSTIWVAQHSPGYNQPLRDVIDRNDTPDHRLNVDWRYWIVHPTHTAANITP
jgi:hypothetical protein